MNKEEIDKNVKAVFKAHPDATKVYVTSDGFIFLTENAARLHQNTNKSGKKLGLASVSKSTSKEGKAAKTDNKKKTLSQMNKTELEAVAKEKGVDISKAANNKDRAKLIKNFKPAPAETPPPTDGSDGGNDNGTSTETTE